jgi:hypothetical protein
VPVLGRSDGPIAGAWCAIVAAGGSPGWIACDLLAVSNGSVAALPIVAPDRSSVHASATPAVYSHADIGQFLQQCRLVEYENLSTHGDTLILIDGSTGAIPYDGGAPNPQYGEIEGLLRSNPQRCGFEVGRVFA